MFNVESLLRDLGNCSYLFFFVLTSYSVTKFHLRNFRLKGVIGDENTH